MSARRLGSAGRRRAGLAAARMAAAIVCLCAFASPSAAQSDTPSAASIDRVRAALQAAGPGPLTLPVLAPATPLRRFGPLTLETPETPGEFVRIRVPIGAFLGRAGRSLAAARHRRADARAHDEVLRALAELAARPTPEADGARPSTAPRRRR